jgi:hypothetical protein
MVYVKLLAQFTHDTYLYYYYSFIDVCYIRQCIHRCDFKIACPETGVMVHISNPKTWEAEAGG